MTEALPYTRPRTDLSVPGVTVDFPQQEDPTVTMFASIPAHVIAACMRALADVRELAAACPRRPTTWTGG